MPPSTRGAVSLPDNPVGAMITGAKSPAGGRLPDSPVSQHITGPRNTLPPSGLEQLQQMTEKASAPVVADYNRRSHGTQGVVPGIKAEDLARIRALAAKYPEQAAAFGGLTDPIDAVIGAAHGAKQVAHGVGQLAAGHIGAGAKNTGLGALGVAAVLPFGKGAGVLRDAGLVARTPEEAAAHAAEVQARAKAEGFGGHVGGKGNPPLIEKGVATPETGGELGRQIREALVRAPSVRQAQNAGYSEERAARFRAAGQARVQAGGGIAGQIAAKRHLADALPKEFFGDWKHLTSADVDQLSRVIDKAPLMEGERTHAIDAIHAAVDHGIVPTKGDQAILERVFGRVAGTPAEGERAPSFWDKFVSYTNIPRAIRSSADVSAGFRQGLVVLVTHPNVWRQAWVKSLKQFGSENYYQASQAAIRNDPWFPVLDKWKVPFTDFGDKTVKGTEEAFVGGQAAEHLHELPGIKGTPVGMVLRPFSNIIRRSDRAFTGFQNETRFQMAKMLGEKAALLGHDLNDQHLGESIAKVVGTFSGRGVTPKILEKHLTTMNAAFFSPRLMASRLNLLSPVYYAKLDPFARAEALRGARNLVAAIGTVMVVAKMLGAQVEFDPRSSNFAKIKVGNTRIDIAGGFSQYVRLLAQEMTGEAISSNGTRSRVKYPGQTIAPKGEISTLDNLTKFARSKAAPIPSMLWDEFSGKDFVGRPVKQSHELWGNAPFISQDALDALQNSGPKSVAVAAFLSAIGFGVQSYKDKPPTASTGGGGGGFGGGSGGFGDNSGGFGDSGGGFGG